MRALALLALPLLLAAASAPAAGSERVVRKARPAFGVVVETIVRVDGDDAARAAAGAAEAALDEVQRVERLVSEADEKSPIAVLNKSAGDEPVVMDPEVFFVLSE